MLIFATSARNVPYGLLFQKNFVDTLSFIWYKFNCDVVVVVNHCFTSLFGTKGLLSNIIIRQKRCSQLIRWVMYSWWCESGGDRAWLVIESVFLRSPDKGFWACLGDIPPDMLKLCGIPRSSAILGSDSPQSNNRKDHSLWVTPFISRERTYVKHAIAGYSRLPRPTSAPALMLVLHWLRCWAEEPGYGTGNPPEDYSQIRRGCSCPWMITVD